MRVLLVEDHRDTRLVLSNLLTRYGHHVLSTETVHHALQLLDGAEFDMLLSDIGLPDGDGCELVGEARRRQPLKMTVALTALVSDDDRARGLRAGFDHYLTKPLDVRHLREVMAAAA